MLANIDYEKELFVKVDASELGIGGVLFQFDEEGFTELPIAFISKAFNDTEKRWPTVEQEMFAIYFAIKQLKCYLLGHHFVVLTDHKNLLSLYKLQSSKIIRWRLELGEFDFAIRHVSGKSNVVPDSLSRLLVIQYNNAEERSKEISAVHNAVRGHRSANKTFEMLRQKGISWAGMKKDVKTFISHCATCQKVRLGQASVVAASKSIAVQEPFERIAVDTVGPLPMDNDGMKYIIVVMDSFSRFVELFAMPDCTSQSAAIALLNVFGRFGAPKQIVSDNGTQFINGLIDDFLSMLKTQRRSILPYRPEANGHVERMNQEVLKHLRALVMDDRIQESWSKWLPLIQRIVNATVHSSIGTTPARVLFGDYVNLDRGILFPFNPEEEGEGTTAEDYVQELIKAQRLILETSQNFQNKVVEKALEKNPAEEDLSEFEQGDLVLMSYPNRPPSKLHAPWRGPFAIVGKTFGNAYICQDLNSLNLKSVHISRLKRYRIDEDMSNLHVAAMDLSGEFVLEKIQSHRGNSKKNLKFLVSWNGYDAEFDTWEPLVNVKDAEQLDVYCKSVSPVLDFLL